MEQEKMKRAREGEDENEIHSYENPNTKKRDRYGINLENDKKEVEERNPKKWDSNLALGVFDFPWLKDGFISKSEEYYRDFDDKFSSTLKREHGALEDAEFGFSEASMEAAYIPETKLWLPLENDGLEIEADDLDCIWSPLLNKPI